MSQGLNPMVIVAALAGVGLLVWSSQSKAAAPEPAPNPNPNPNPNPGPFPKKTDAECAAAKSQLAALVTAAQTAATNYAKSPMDLVLAQKAATAASAAAQAGTVYAQQCGPLVASPSPTTQQKPTLEQMGALDYGKLMSQLDQMTGGGAGGLSSQCQTLMRNYQLASSTAAQYETMAQASPNDASLALQANNALASALSAGQAYQQGCPDVPALDSWISSMANWHPSSPSSSGSSGGGGALPSHLANRWSPEAPLTVTARPSSVPRLSQWPATELVGSSSGACSPGAPELKFTEYGIWPVVGNSIVTQCQCDPICSGVDPREVAAELNKFGALLSTLSDPTYEIAPADVANITSELGDAEADLKTHAPGVFTRYLAALFAMFAGLLPDLTDENDKAVATHVILVTKGLLKSMGVNVAKVPQLPFVFNPRNTGDGALLVPMWSTLKLFPGIG